jgi:hypothetical protein
MSVEALFNELDVTMGPDKSAEFKAKLAEHLAQYNQASSALSTTSTDRRARDLFDTVDDPQVVAIRDRLSAAKRAMDEANELRKAAIDAIKSQLGESVSDEKKTELRASRNLAKKHVVALFDGINTLATVFFNSEALAAAAAEASNSVFGKGRRGTGSGQTKARVQSVHAVHPNGQDVEEKSFSKVALRTKLDITLMQKAWYEAAGTDNWKEITQPYTYNVGEWGVTVTPRPPKSDEDTPSEG